MICPVLLPLHDRDDVHQRRARHDDARGVDAPLPLQPLDAAPRVDDLAHLGVVLVQLAELRPLAVARVLQVEHLVDRHILAMAGGVYALVIFSPRANGLPRTRLASLIACFALIVP